MTGFQSPNYTQVPNDLFEEYMSQMGETELKVILAIVRQTIGYHREQAKYSISKLEKMTGLSRNGVKAGAEAAEKRGLIVRTNPDTQGSAEWSLVMTPSANDPLPPQPVTPTPSASEGQLGLNKDKEKNKKNSSLPLDWKIATGQEITQDDLEKEQKEKDVLIEFESAFGFGALPWYSSKEWEKFAHFLMRLANDDPGWPADYVQWRQGDGKYKAFSNRKIRENIQAFMDTGYPEYDACKMYREQEELPAYYKPFVEEKKDAIPNPGIHPNIARPR